MTETREKYRWSLDRTNAVVQGWRNSVPINDIARQLGTSRSAVVAKAEVLRLGPHPLSSAASNDTAPVRSRPPLTKMDPDERAKYIKLPSLTFLEHRFGWEI